MKPGSAVVVGLAVLLWGCSAETPRPASYAGPARSPAVTRVALEDHLAWPYELERVVVVVDGAVVAITSAPVQHDLGAFELVAGEHTVQYLAEVSYASGSTDTGCKAQLRGSHSFDTPPSSLVLDVFARGVTHPFAERLAVALRTPNGSTTPGPAYSAWDSPQSAEDSCN